MGRAMSAVGRSDGEPGSTPPKPPEEEAADARPVHVSFLIDRSGSMSDVRDAVVDGLNDFVAEQKRVAGRCRFTLVQFDGEDPFDVVYDAQPIEDVPELAREQYRPRGMTPLLDAMGELITAADRRLEARREVEDQVVAVFTDGLENASRTWTRGRLLQMVEERIQRGWVFTYLGANQDSFLEAGKLGLSRENVRDFVADEPGMRGAMRAVSDAVVAYCHAPSARRQERARQFLADADAEVED